MTWAGLQLSTLPSRIRIESLFPLLGDGSAAKSAELGVREYCATTACAKLRTMSFLRLSGLLSAEHVACEAVLHGCAGCCKQLFGNGGSGHMRTEHTDGIWFGAFLRGVLRDLLGIVHRLSHVLALLQLRLPRPRDQTFGLLPALLFW